MSGDPPPCCANASWVAERDLDGARGFEFDLGRCERCGTPWMKVWCVASSMGAYEPIDLAEADCMRTAAAGPELAARVRAWAKRVI